MRGMQLHLYQTDLSCFQKLLMLYFKSAVEAFVFFDTGNAGCLTASELQRGLNKLQRTLDKLQVQRLLYCHIPQAITSLVLVVDYLDS